MSAEDLQIIIPAVYPETTVEFDVVAAFIMADPYDKPEGWDIFWGQLGLAWQKAYKGDTSVQTMLSCKQNPREDFYSFLVCLHKIYHSLIIGLSLQNVQRVAQWVLMELMSNIK